MAEEEPNLQELFPGKRRRTLVENFVKNVSERPGVEKVISVELGEKKPRQELMVMTEGADFDIPTSAEMDEVRSAYFYTCQTPYRQALLGHVPAVTELELVSFRQTWAEFMGKEVHVLWQKPVEQS